jgi:monovalent cation:H+ antiporter-2, CPA2 family
MLVKTVVLLITGKLFKLKTDQNLLFSFGLSQVGEFAFVLFAFIRQLNIMETATIDLMMAVTAISMVVTPVLLMVLEHVILPRFGTKEAPEKQADNIDEQHAVIISGFGHFGSTIGRFLRANGVEATILDNDSDRVDSLRRMGFKVYYGDATRLDLLKSAGADDARLIIMAIDDKDTRIQAITTIRKHFPKLHVMTRANNRFDAFELMEMGIEDIYRESIDTSLRMGVDVLKRLGYRTYSAYRSSQHFFRYDESALQKLVKARGTAAYIDMARREIELQEKLLAEDRQQTPADSDHAWDSQQMRDFVNQKKD